MTALNFCVMSVSLCKPGGRKSYIIGQYHCDCCEWGQIHVLAYPAYPVD